MLLLKQPVTAASINGNLALLCWNRTDRFLTDRDAFGLYERNWRFVDTKRMPREERDLIGRLAAKYGNGVLNV